MDTKDIIGRYEQHASLLPKHIQLKPKMKHPTTILSVLKYAIFTLNMP